MTKIVRDAAPKILEAIKASNNILLHCHPSPDPDSVGSALAMKFALESLGKKATVIQGDNEIPGAFMHFPGADTIVRKNFFEVDLAAFDLFIIQDTGDLKRVSRMGEVRIPETMKTIAIDHHDSTLPFGTSANLIDSSYPSTTAMLFDLFKLWKIEITSEIAANLFIGTYTDTGGFKYPKTSSETFAMASELARTCPQFSKLIAVMEDSRPAEEIILLGTLLGGIRTFLNGRLAIGSISEETFKEKGFDPAKGSGSFGSSMMRSVIGWDIVVSCIEIQSGVTKASFRAKDGEAFDVSKLAIALGGGGHKAAAGAVLTMPLEAAIEKIVATAKEIYNL